MSETRPKRTRLRTAGRAMRPRLDAASLARLESTLDHRFTQPDLAHEALTHPSAVSAHRGAVKGSYQRLEFLGDRVLGLVIAERLFDRRRNEREGLLAPRLNRLVNKAACAEAARHMGLGPLILMAPHEAAAGGAERDSTLGDVCEAVIGALYLDGGLRAARAFIERAWAPQFRGLTGEHMKDPKTRLQEWAQSRGHPLPAYEVEHRQGPDHAPRFTVRVHVGEGLTALGEERSKQEAERAAAERLLHTVEGGSPDTEDDHDA